MDPQLSLIMANMAQVKPHSFIYDPFVGTGSLLVGAAHFGSHVSGADLDYNLIHSRGLSSRQGQKYRRKDQSIRNNLKQYGMESYFVDILVADFSKQYLRDDFKFDSIITDPPYGIREKTKRLGSSKKKSPIQSDEEAIKLNEHADDVKEIEINELAEEDLENLKIHPTQTKYMLADIFHDLLVFSAKHLLWGGRLVYWLPIYLDESERMAMKYIYTKIKI
jgi:tRNA (guanine10-N2)-methyltransferase